MGVFGTTTNHAAAGRRRGALMGTSAMRGEAVTGTGQRIWSENLGAELQVARCSWSAETARARGTEAIIAGQVAADWFVATMDGRAMAAGWHEGLECGQAVYFERYEAGECVSHGWLDAESRQIVQAG
jgi:hypothetical protein